MIVHSIWNKATLFAGVWCLLALHTSVKRATHPEIALNLNACVSSKYLQIEFHLVIYGEHFIQLPFQLINMIFDGIFCCFWRCMISLLRNYCIQSKKNGFLEWRNTEGKNQREERRWFDIYLSSVPACDRYVGGGDDAPRITPACRSRSSNNLEVYIITGNFVSFFAWNACKYLESLWGCTYRSRYSCILAWYDGGGGRCWNSEE